MPKKGSSLSSRAFGAKADPGLIVAYESHQDALRFLSASLSQANGIALLQGPTGSGKSTIVNEQCVWSARDAAVALLDGRNLTPRGLLTGMLSQFGIETIAQHDEQMLELLNNFVTRQALESQAPLLILDNVDRATLSTLRLLNWIAALEVHGRYAMRIVLTGRERLSALVHEDAMRGLGRRNPASYSLNPLTVQEAMIYLRTRLIAAGGGKTEKVFPSDVCEKLHEKSRGWPSRLNELALEVMDRIAELKSARSCPRVIVTCDGETVADYLLTKSQYLIGRTDLADIVIEDSYVSKMHAMLKVYSNALVLVDLNSTNGTTVNSSETPKTVLRSNDIISLGRHRLKIENAPKIDAKMDEAIRSADTLTLQTLEDLRRSRARHTIAALKHK